MKGIIRNRKGITQMASIAIIAVIVVVLVIGGAWYYFGQPEGPTQVTALIWVYPPMSEYAAIMHDVAAEVNVEFVDELVGGSEFMEKMRIQGSAGSSTYDILWANNNMFIEWADAEWLAPLDDLLDKYWDEYDLDDIPQGAWDALTWNGKIYGVPSLLGAQAFFYNDAALEEKGINPPETYDDWIVAAEALNDPDAGIYGYGYGMVNHDMLTATFGPFLWSHGGDFFDEDLNPIFNSPEGVEALETFLELAQYAPPGAISYSTDELTLDLQQGIVMTAINYGTRMKAMDDPEFSKVVGEMEFALFPDSANAKGKGGRFIDAFSISAFSENKEEALLLILEALGSENMVRVVALSIVSRESIALDPQVAEEYRWYPITLELSASGGDLPALPEFPAVAEKLMEEVQRALRGEKTAQEALDDAAEWAIDYIAD